MPKNRKCAYTLLQRSASITKTMEQENKRKQQKPAPEELEEFRNSLGERASGFTEVELIKYHGGLVEMAELLLDIYCDNHGIPCESDAEEAVRPQPGVRSRARRARNKKR
jgi:hypothetical protein